jgi:uncharacterized protein (TIGR03067 family)
MTRYIVTVLVAGLLLAAEGKKGDAKKDQEALQGTWRPVSTEQGGQDQTDQAKEYALVFDKDTFTVKRGDEVVIKGTFTVDPSKKPRAIDMKITEAKRDEDNGKDMHGIYELDKDSLRWCTSGPGVEGRPKEFATKEGTRDLLVTLKKDKP